VPKLVRFTLLASLLCLALPAAALAVTRTGVLERAHAHQLDGSTRFFWALSTRFSLDPVTVSRPQRLQGHRVRVTGSMRAGRLVAARGGVRDLGRPLARKAANDRNVAVILLNFSNEPGIADPPNPTPPIPKSYAENGFEGPSNPPGYSVREYFATQTYGALALHVHVFGSFDLHDVPTPTNPCNLGSLANDAINAAETNDPSFNADDYQHFVYMFTYTGKCSFAGVGAQPGGSVWVNGQSIGTADHELGHNFNAPHGALYRCLDGNSQPVPYSDNCSYVSSEYGDPFDPMGGGYAFWYPNGTAEAAYEMDPFRKLGLGGVTKADLPEIHYSGTYNLAPSEAASGARMLRLATGDGEFFDLTLRRGGISAFDPFQNDVDPVTKGVSIRIDSPNLGPTPSRLLDFTPGTGSGVNDFVDGALPVGGSFTVPKTGATIHVDSVSQAGAVVKVAGLPDPPPPTGGGGGGGSTTPPAGGTTNSGGATQTASAAGLFSSGLAVTCTAPTGCTVTGDVSAKVPASIAKARPKVKTVALGHSSLQLANGKRAVVKIKLTAKGRRILARLRKLKVTVTIRVKASGRKTVVKTRTLTLKAPKPNRKKRR
jgi:hypothetical protein